jgi:hypothetical protein
MSAEEKAKDRLGDILIRKGLISKAELDQAVQCQVLFGGRLGTNILESGGMSEEDLEDILAEKYNVEAVRFEDLKEIPSQVIHQIPTEFAIQHQVIPCKIRGNNLMVAMMEPVDRQLIGEIAAETGMTIRSGVALEVYIRWALERYYGCKRDARFINLERSLALRRELKAHPPAERKPAASPGESLWRGGETTPGLLSQPLLPDPLDITSVEGVPRSLEEFWERVGRTSSHPRHMLPRVLRELKQAQNREQIAQIVLDYANRLMPRVALFFIKSGVVFGWDGRGERLNRAQVSGIMIPLELQSVFKTVHDTGAYFLGPPPDTAINHRFVSAMGGLIPGASLLMPISLFGRVVAILYGDMGPKRELTADVSDLQPVLVESGNALLRLIKESKAKNPAPAPDKTDEEAD